MCLGRNESYAKTVRSFAGEEERKARKEEHEKDLAALKPIVEPCLARSQKEGSGTGGDRPSGEPQTLSKGLLYPVQLLQGTLGGLSPAWVHLHICKAKEPGCLHTRYRFLSASQQLKIRPNKISL